MGVHGTNYSITKDGLPLSPSLYTLCAETKVFSSPVSGLNLNFTGFGGWTFKIMNGCSLRTGSCCTIDSGHGCFLDTKYGCTFDAGTGCTFDVGNDCTISAYSDITIVCGKKCVLVRRCDFEVLKLPAGSKVRVESGEKGYKLPWVLRKLERYLQERKK